MSKGFKRSSLAAAIALLVQQGAWAEDVVELEAMVVSATGFEQKITDAPASISVITEDELKSRPFITVLDAVKYLEGVDVGTTRDKSGQASVSMRGLPGDYTLILIDGKRQNNHGDIYPNNFGGNQFNHIPPLEAIERVEVIRGPASTLYGADALGGVINIITKKHSDHWMGAVSVSRTLQTDDSFGEEFTTDFTAMGPLVPGVLSAAVRGSIYDRNGSAPEFAAVTAPNGQEFSRSLGFGGGGKTTDNTNKEFGFGLNWTLAPGQNIKFDYDNSRQKYDNTPVRNPITGEMEYPLGTKDNLESIWRASRNVVQPRVGYAADQKFTREWWSVGHEGKWSWATSNVSLSYVDTDNKGRTIPFSVAERNLLQQMWDGTGAYSSMTLDERRALAGETFLPRDRRTLESSQYTLDASLNIPLKNLVGDHMLVVGGQVIDGELDDSVFGMEEGTTSAIQDQKMYSLFAEDSWMPTDSLTVTGGLRYDKHDLFGSHLSPRLYGVYKVATNWTVKGGVSTGYKTPKTTDLYDGITGFGGQGTSPFFGNPDLKPETSVSREIALYWDHPDRHNFNVTYFQTDFEDKISSGETIQSCDTTGGVRPCVNAGDFASLGYATATQKINIDKVDIQGVEVAGRYQISQDWSLLGNYTWTDSEQKSGKNVGKPLTNTAEHMANATLDWMATDSINLFLQGELRSDRYRSTVNGEDRYFKDYTMLHLGARWQVNESVAFNARINNLLDKDFTTYKTTFTDVDGDGQYSTSTSGEVTYLDDYNVKDKARNFWLSTNIRF